MNELSGGAGIRDNGDGADRKRLPSDQGLTRFDLKRKYPYNSWAGERKDLYLPYLFIRAQVGDNGSRPLSVGTVTWESPDILIAPGDVPAGAQLPTFAENAIAGIPNTIYAHVWNFGQSSALQTVVNFYWCNPALVNAQENSTLLGQVVTELGARGSGRSHALVRCPNLWFPTYDPQTSGHECLIAKVWDYTSDALGTPEWDARLNRHVAQHNLHVVKCPPKHKGMMAPLLIRVGPLQGASAQISVKRVSPSTVSRLQMRTDSGGKFPKSAMPTGFIGLLPPAQISESGRLMDQAKAVQNTRVSSAKTEYRNFVLSGQVMTTQRVEGRDDQQIAFVTTDVMPNPGEAHAYRVTASQNGKTIGGYTVVLLG